ncbi:unnamed protein product [Camellia sinensis]
MASSSPASINSKSTSSANKYPYPGELDVSKLVPDNLSATANNYDQWKQQRLQLIKNEGLFHFIDSTNKAPSKIVTVLKKDVENQDYISWKRSNDLLQKWIRTRLTEEIDEEVKHFQNARVLWTYLEKLFSSKLPKLDVSATAMASSSSSSVNSFNVSDFVKKSLSVSEKNYSGRDTQVRGELIRTKLAKDILQEMADIMPDRTAKAMWVALNKIFGHYVRLYKATIKGDWERAEEFIKQEPDNLAMRAAIRDNSETVLIVAVKSKQRNNFVKKLLEIKMNNTENRGKSPENRGKEIYKI